MQKIAAKIIADSASPSGKRITTFQLVYPRVIHGELMTHRVFERNAMSSRAIPVAKMIAQVRNDPWIPTHWGKNQAGMQAGENLTPVQIEQAREEWLGAAADAAESAEVLSFIGLHKQIANRLLEPFQWMHTIVTATEFDNFYALRDHHMAEPHFQDLARAMKVAHGESTPASLRPGHWHVPYVEWVYSAGSPGRSPRQVFKQFSHDGEDWHPIDLETALKVSTARCARVSYLNHDGTRPDLEKDLELYEVLVERPSGNNDPIHASPAGHQASPDNPSFDGHGWESPGLHGCFKGWVQHRRFIETDRAASRKAAA